MKYDRQAYIDGLRALATVLEDHPEVELPVEGTILPLAFNFWGDDARERMAAAARAIPAGAWAKQAGDTYFKLDGKLAGLNVQLAAHRDAVCTRVVTGTEDREVEEEVTPAVVRKVVKSVEVVEWQCGSILADR